MFKKLRFKLIILNTIVFFILFSIFNLVIYFYAKSRLYMGVDKSLMISRKLFEINLEKNIQNIPSLDPRIIIIQRDNKGNVLSDINMPVFYKINEQYIKPIKINQLYDVKFKEFNFRTIAFSAESNNKTITVQLLRNTNSEKEFLNNLLKIIAWGGSIILIVSIGAGGFLAEKAMTPIITAWEKQRQFVEDASHELRTPLTVVKSQVELILKTPDAKVIDKASYLANVLSETRRLSRLVADLLTLARSDSNVIEIKKNTVDMYVLMQKVIEPYIEIAEVENKNIKAELQEHCLVNCDEERIHQLLVILLDNALKYTYNGGNIEINLKRKAGKCNIIVKDDGIGIKEEEKKLIFQRFYRGDKSRTRETGGAGLGLSIAKWIVEKHGGTITASQNFPRGTSIEVILPSN